MRTDEAVYIKGVIGATEALGDTIGQLSALLYEHAGDSEEVEELVTVSRQVIDAMINTGESLLCDTH